MEVDLPYSDMENGVDSDSDEGPTQRTRSRAGRWQPSPQGNRQADHDDSNTLGGKAAVSRSSGRNKKNSDGTEKELLRRDGTSRPSFGRS
jgi:hypothetical protein